MDRDFLAEYQQNEIDRCQRLFSDAEFQASSVAARLRLIYGAPLDREVVYCETGGVDNLDSYPHDKTIVLTVFPYKSPVLFEKHLGSMAEFLDNCRDNQRIIPVVQSPMYYEGLTHLDPLFRELRAPSYFIRGQFAYATIMGEKKPELALHRNGGSALLSVINLMDHCSSKHNNWLEQALADSDCWESRYRKIGPLGRNRDPLRQSLIYRYASVAYCLGQEVADAILESFPYEVASKVLLHFHILFDHVIAHGFGSSFSVDKRADEGRDFFDSRVGLTRQLEQLICNDVALLIPRQKSEYFKDLLRYEHPLQGIRIDTLQPGDFEEIASRIHAQFERFTKKVKSLEKKKTLIKRSFSISLLAAGGLIGSENFAAGAALGAAGVEFKDFKVPEALYAGTVGALQRLYQHNLALYLLSSKWEPNHTHNN